MVAAQVVVARERPAPATTDRPAPATTDRHGHDRGRGRDRRQARAGGIAGGLPHPDGGAQVSGRQRVRLAIRPADGGAGVARGIATLPLIPLAGHGARPRTVDLGQGLTLHRGAGDRRWRETDGPGGAEEGVVYVIDGDALTGRDAVDGGQ